MLYPSAQMVGWAWTWDPDAPTPIAMFSDTFARAARSRLVKDLRVSKGNVREVCVWGGGGSVVRLHPAKVQ